MGYGVEPGHCSNTMYTRILDLSFGNELGLIHAMQQVCRLSLYRLHFSLNKKTLVSSSRCPFICLQGACNVTGLAVQCSQVKL